MRTSSIRAALAFAVASAAFFSYPVDSAMAGKSFSGTASWYGRYHHGKRTASGEIFDMGKLTAAHRSLAFGTRVKVTNRRNGKSVVVRITDRGPYVGKRVLDLSRAAAQNIGMVGSGTAPVTVEVLGK